MKSNPDADVKVLNVDNLPRGIDWKEQGAVTMPMKQGDCGACWAITAAGALEAAYFRQTKDLLQLSTQQLLDCVNRRTGGNLGCDGGFIDHAFDYSVTNPVFEEKFYPYKQNWGKCRLPKVKP